MRQGGENGWGAAFQLTPPADGEGAWRQRALYTFDLNASPLPNDQLTIGPDGALYGVSTGVNDAGTVFRLSRKAGQWTRDVLYTFAGAATTPPDGAAPVGRLSFGADGSIYGTTEQGGSDSSCGMVYRLRPIDPTLGKYKFQAIHRFDIDHGCHPEAGVLIGPDGALYGTTADGGDTANGLGTVYRLAPSATGRAWKFAVLHFFTSTDGANPRGELIMDEDGALYGTTQNGGTFGDGTLFRLAPLLSRPNRWRLRTLHMFDMGDSTGPEAGLVRGPDGALYGTTPFGGRSGHGMVFKLVP
jgi:uncharacterized repeat protein (TIGR03803 family)